MGHVGPLDLSLDIEESSAAGGRHISLEGVACPRTPSDTLLFPKRAHVSLSLCMGGWGTTDCLRFFTRVEELEEDERYLCAKCGVRQRSTKKFSIRHNPTVRRVSLAPNPSPSLNCARLQVLCLQLKRFRWGTYTRSKVRDAVAFPVHALDLAPFVDPRSPYVQRPPLYDLCAVVIHHGGGYVCVCVCLCLCVCVCG
jgi:hypothetical protein